MTIKGVFYVVVRWIELLRGPTFPFAGCGVASATILLYTRWNSVCIQSTPTRLVYAASCLAVIRINSQQNVNTSFTWVVRARWWHNCKPSQTCSTILMVIRMAASMKNNFSTADLHISGNDADGLTACQQQSTDILDVRAAIREFQLWYVHHWNTVSFGIELASVVLRLRVAMMFITYYLTSVVRSRNQFKECPWSSHGIVWDIMQVCTV